MSVWLDGHAWLLRKDVRRRQAALAAGESTAAEPVPAPVPALA